MVADVRTNFEDEMKKKIVVLGGYGALGRQIGAMLARDAAIDCVVAGRDAERGRALAASIGARFQALDINNATALSVALDGAYAVVDTCGPFDTRSYLVAEACIQNGAHYVDVADTRAYVEGFRRLDEAARAKGCLLVTGAGAALGVATVLADSLAERYERVDEIHVAVTTGNLDRRGPATLRTVLGYAGRSLDLMEQGRWRKAFGWSRGTSIRFPAPVGKRRGYLSDTPDLDIFPPRYGAHTVTARNGMQLRLLNRGISLLARLRRHRRIDDLSRHSRWLLKVAKMFRAKGDATGGIRVQMRGEAQGHQVEHLAYLVARDSHGAAIACSPAVALIHKWVHHGVATTGATACVDLLTLDDIRRVLLGYDIFLVYA
jgi:saccharopine dehydrogenase-like NADP-dependent oxidoreductase